MPHVAASLTQSAFRFRNDDGSETTATWKAAENTPVTIDTGETFRLRFVVQETAGGGENNVTFQLQRNLTGGWVNVTTTSAVVRAVDSAVVVNGQTTTNQIGGSGTFQADEVSNDGLSDLVNPNFSGSDHTEAEFTVQIVGADVADEDTIQLRVVRSGGSLEAWTQTPTLTVAKAAGPLSTSGGSSTSVNVAVAATGSKAASGGSAAQVTVTAAGDGQKAALGGSAVSTSTGATGGGQKVTSDGSDAIVTVATTGGGQGSVAGGGGSTAIVTVATAGDGTKVASGGSDATVTTTTTGGGERAVETHSGGSSVSTTTSVTGVGAKGGEGGAADTVIVTVSGAGVKAATEGSAANVLVEVTGGGARQAQTPRTYLEGHGVSTGREAHHSSGVRLEGSQT